MDESVRHFEDRNHEFTGSEGRWTICGERWAEQPEVGADCRACVDAVVEYAKEKARARGR